MTGRAIPEDEDAQPVIVPRSERPLGAAEPERVWRLRKHLIAVLRRARTMGDSTPVRPELTGFAARVAAVGCTMCGGFCCKGGGDHAYLDEATMVRVRASGPRLSARGMLRSYLARVPAESYRGSCVFHGAKGCTLDRWQRSDVCNDYFCAGLDAFLRGGDLAAPAVVNAGERDKMRTSPVLVP